MSNTTSGSPTVTDRPTLSTPGGKLSWAPHLTQGGDGVFALARMPAKEVFQAMRAIAPPHTAAARVALAMRGGSSSGGGKRKLYYAMAKAVGDGDEDGKATKFDLFGEGDHRGALPMSVQTGTGLLVFERLPGGVPVDARTTAISFVARMTAVQEAAEATHFAAQTPAAAAVDGLNLAARWEASVNNQQSLSESTAHTPAARALQLPPAGVNMGAEAAGEGGLAVFEPVRHGVVTVTHGGGTTTTITEPRTSAGGDPLRRRRPPMGTMRRAGDSLQGSMNMPDVREALEMGGVTMEGFLTSNHSDRGDAGGADNDDAATGDDMLAPHRTSFNCARSPWTLRYRVGRIEEEYLQRAHSPDSVALALARFGIALGSCIVMTMACIVNVFLVDIGNANRHNGDAPWLVFVLAPTACVCLLAATAASIIGFNKSSRLCCEAGSSTRTLQVWSSELLCIPVMICVLCARLTVSEHGAAAGWITGFDNDDVLLPSRLPRILVNTVRYAPVPIYMAFLPSRLTTLAPCLVALFACLVVSSMATLAEGTRERWKTISPYGAVAVWAVEAIIAFTIVRALEERRRNDFEQRVRGGMRGFHTRQLAVLQEEVISRCRLISAEQHQVLSSQPRRWNRMHEFKSEAVVVTFNLTTVTMPACDQLDAKSLLVYNVEDVAAALRTDLIRFASCGDRLSVAIGLMPAGAAPEARVGTRRRVPSLKTHCVLACAFCRIVMRSFTRACIENARFPEGGVELRIGVAAGTVLSVIDASGEVHQQHRSKEAAPSFFNAARASDGISERLHVTGYMTRLAQRFSEETTVMTARVSSKVVQHTQDFYHMRDPRKMNFEDRRIEQATLALPTARMHELEDDLEVRVQQYQATFEPPLQPFVLEHKMLLDTMTVDANSGATPRSSQQQQQAPTTTTTGGSGANAFRTGGTAGPQPTTDPAVAAAQVSIHGLGSSGSPNGQSAQRSAEPDSPNPISHRAHPAQLPKPANAIDGGRRAANANANSRSVDIGVSSLPGFGHALAEESLAHAGSSRRIGFTASGPTVHLTTTGSRMHTNLRSSPSALTASKTESGKLIKPVAVELHCTPCGWRFSDPVAEAGFHWAENEGSMRLLPLVGVVVLWITVVGLLLAETDVRISSFSWMLIVVAAGLVIAIAALLKPRYTPGWKRMTVSTMLLAPCVLLTFLGAIVLTDADDDEAPPPAVLFNSTLVAAPPPPTSTTLLTTGGQAHPVLSTTTPTPQQTAARQAAQTRELFYLISMLVAHTVLPVVPSKVPAVCAAYLIAPLSWLTSQVEAHGDVYTDNSTGYDLVGVAIAAVLFMGVVLGLRFGSRRAFHAAVKSDALVTAWLRQKIHFKHTLEAIAPAVVARRFTDILDRANGVQLASEYEDSSQRLMRVHLEEASVLTIDTEPKKLEGARLTEEMNARRAVVRLLRWHPQAQSGSEFEVYWVEHGTGWAIIAGVNTDANGDPQHPRLERELLLQEVADQIARLAEVKQSLSLMAGIGSGPLECDIVGSQTARFEIAGQALNEAVGSRSLGVAHLLDRVRGCNRRSAPGMGGNVNVNLSQGDIGNQSVSSRGSIRRTTGRYTVKKSQAAKSEIGGESLSPLVALNAANLAASEHRRRLATSTASTSIIPVPLSTPTLGNGAGFGASRSGMQHPGESGHRPPANANESTKTRTDSFSGSPFGGGGAGNQNGTTTASGVTAFHAQPQTPTANQFQTPQGQKVQPFR